MANAPNRPGPWKLVHDGITATATAEVDCRWGRHLLVMHQTVGSTGGYCYLEMRNGSTEKSVGGQVSTIIATATAGAVRTTNVVTITTTAVHGLVAGDMAIVSGVDSSTFNGTFAVASAATTTTFTYAQTAADETSQNGSVRGIAQVAHHGGGQNIKSSNTTTPYTSRFDDVSEYVGVVCSVGGGQSWVWCQVLSA
jgi:hypothetical protein